MHSEKLSPGGLAVPDISVTNTMSATVDERVADELEALEAILMSDVRVKRVGGVPKIVETVVHPSTGNNTDQQFVCLTLEVNLTPKYPDESPKVVLRNSRGLDDQVLSSIYSQITAKLKKCVGQPVVFELIEIIRDNLTRSNLPSGQCVICLYGFKSGDAFIKTQCYHYFHKLCLAGHLLSDKKYYHKEYNKLPSWQQMQAAPYRQTCPVCRSQVSCDIDTLSAAPPPVESIAEPPFRLTADMRALQARMAALLARQVAKGGVVGVGDNGPPPLTITSPSDKEDAGASSSGSQDGAKAECSGSASGSASASGCASGSGRQAGTSSNTPGTPPQRPVYRGPYRGFNRRGKPGRRGRGGR